MLLRSLALGAVLLIIAFNASFAESSEAISSGKNSDKSSHSSRKSKPHFYSRPAKIASSRRTSSFPFDPITEQFDQKLQSLPYDPSLFMPLGIDLDGFLLQEPPSSTLIPFVNSSPDTDSKFLASEIVLVSNQSRIIQNFAVKLTSTFMLAMFFLLIYNGFFVHFIK